MADIYIENGHLITLDRERRSIENGAVAVENGYIVAVGPAAELAPLYRATAAKVIDAGGKAILPGLVDAHAHAGHGLMKTVGGGVANAWARACGSVYSHFSPPAFWRAEAALSALERLKCGTTTGLSILGGGDGTMRTDRPDYAMAHIEATRSVGIRSILAVGPSHPEFPREMTDHVDGDKPLKVSAEQQIEVCRELVGTVDRSEDGLVHLALSLSLLTPAMLVGGRIEKFWYEHAEAIRGLSRDNGLLFTQDGHLTGSIAISHELGLLGRDALMSHCIDIEQSEIDLIAETDTRVVSNPSAVYAIRGRCPVIELLDLGVTVAFGSDGTAPDRSNDMFRHMQQGMHYHRRHFRDSQILPPGKTLEMVTIDAARAIGLESEIGSLEVGKRADIILIDLDQPHLYPRHMPLWRIVAFANGADVDTVIVGGVVLMEGRVVQSVNESDVLMAAQEEADRAFTAAGMLGELSEPQSLWFNPRF